MANNGSTRAAGVQIDGANYVLVQDHETYMVADVPSQPDADRRMERRVVYDGIDGINHRREAAAVDLAQSIYTSSYSRQVRAGVGLWWANGGDTRTLDRIFAQRATINATYSGVINGGSYYQQLLDDGSGLSVAVSDYDLSTSAAITATAQTLTRQFNLNTYWASNGGTGVVPRAVTDAVSYAGKVFIASCATATDTTQPGNVIPDYTKPQEYLVWDELIADVPLEAPQPYASPGYPSVVPGTTGVTTFGYFIVATDDTGKFSSPSQLVKITNGPNNLASGSQIAITMPAAYPSGMGANPKFNIYRSGDLTLKSQFDMRGLIGTATINGVFQDTGQLPTAEYAPVTPGFAVGDTGLATCFVVIRDTLWRAAGAKMWGWHGVNTGIQSAQGSWSTVSRIGDPNTPITALDVFEDDMLIFKPDGLWTMDRGGNVFPVFPGVRMPGLNPRPLGQWRGNYYFAADFGMVWEWDGQVINSIGFDKSEPYPMPSGDFGIPNASTKGIPLPNFLLVGFNEANNSYNAGFVLAFDGKKWHPFHFDPLNRITSLGIGGVSQIPAVPVLQIGKGRFDKSGPLVHYITKPTLDPLLITTFDTGLQTFYFPVDNGIIGDEYKILESVRIYVDKASTGSVRMYYSADDDIQNQVFYDMGVPKNDRQFIQSFVLTDPLPAYRKVLLKMTIQADATTASPVIRTTVMRYKQREFQRKSWDLVLFLEEGQLTSQRSRDTRTSQQMLAALNALRQSKATVQFKDLLGDEHSVYVESVEESLKTYKVTNRGVTLTCKVRLVEPVALID